MDMNLFLLPRCIFSTLAKSLSEILKLK